jgi:hypothetical protein
MNLAGDTLAIPAAFSINSRCCIVNRVLIVVVSGAVDVGSAALERLRSGFAGAAVRVFLAMRETP